jgi:hypothetical protein
MRLILLAAALAGPAMLAGCVTPGSAKQGLYQAYGSYSIALGAAADYAESPTADPAIVRRLNAANRAEPVQFAIKYGRAYVQCSGSNATVVPGVDCTGWDFRSKTASGYAIVLRSLATSLLVRK